MMQLKYMVNNTDEAAAKLLANWKPAPAEIHFFRASSNFLHIFKAAGNWRFLRFNRIEERDIATLEAELEFLKYLQDNKYPAAYPVLSQNDRYIEAVEDSNGKYYGMVFERASGKELSPQDRTPAEYNIWGAELGRLHNLSRKYRPEKLRPSYQDYLAKFQRSFTQWGEQEALVELELISMGLGRLNRTEENFGLIHYDFQYDNTFWNEEKNRFYVIDFDDAHYHFYAMDLIYAMEDLDDGPENPEACIKSFYDGYRSVSPLDEDVFAHRHIFSRYSNLMHFWRITRSMRDSSFAQAPDWLTKLKPLLEDRCANLRESFKHNAQAD